MKAQMLNNTTTSITPANGRTDRSLARSPVGSTTTSSHSNITCYHDRIFHHPPQHSASPPPPHSAAAAKLADINNYCYILKPKDVGVCVSGWYSYASQQSGSKGCIIMNYCIPSFSVGRLLILSPIFFSPPPILFCAFRLFNYCWMLYYGMDHCNIIIMLLIMFYFFYYIC